MTKDDPYYSPLLDPKFWTPLTGEADADLTDFHETPEGAPFMWMLGRIVIDFNYAEQQLKALLWAYIGESFEAGHALTSALGSSSVVKLLEDCAKRADEPQDIRELIKFGGTAFDICRQNRNALAHSITVERLESDTDTVWIRSSRKLGFQQMQMKIRAADIWRVSKEIADTALFLSVLQMNRHFALRGQPEEIQLPTRFPMPRRLRSREVNIRSELKKFDVPDDW